MESTNNKTLLIFDNIIKSIQNKKYKNDMIIQDKENFELLIEICFNEQIIEEQFANCDFDKIINDYFSILKIMWTGDDRFNRNRNIFHTKKFIKIDNNIQDGLKDFIEKLKEFQEESPSTINFEIKLIKYQPNIILHNTRQKYTFIILFRKIYTLFLFEFQVEINDFDLMQYIVLFRQKNIFYKTENFEPKYILSNDFLIELEFPNNKYNYYMENRQNDMSQFDFDKIKLAESREFIITKDNKKKLTNILERALKFKDDNKDMVIYKLDKQKMDNRVKICVVVNNYKYLYTFIIKIEKEKELNQLWKEIDIFC